MVYNQLDSQRTHHQYQYQNLVCILHDINIFESTNILILDIPALVHIQVQNNLNLFNIATKKEFEPCGRCSGSWCPCHCKDGYCGECEKGLECNRMNRLKEPPGLCEKILSNHITHNMLMNNL